MAPNLTVTTKSSGMSVNFRMYFLWQFSTHIPTWIINVSVNTLHTHTNTNTQAKGREGKKWIRKKNHSLTPRCHCMIFCHRERTKESRVNLCDRWCLMSLCLCECLCVWLWLTDSNLRHGGLDERESDRIDSWSKANRLSHMRETCEWAPRAHTNKKTHTHRVARVWSLRLCELCHFAEC